MGSKPNAEAKIRAASRKLTRAIDEVIDAAKKAENARIELIQAEQKCSQRSPRLTDLSLDELRRTLAATEQAVGPDAYSTQCIRRALEEVAGRTRKG